MLSNQNDHNTAVDTPDRRLNKTHIVKVALPIALIAILLTIYSLHTLHSVDHKNSAYFSAYLEKQLTNNNLTRQSYRNFERLHTTLMEIIISIGINRNPERLYSDGINKVDSLNKLVEDLAKQQENENLSVEQRNQIPPLIDAISQYQGYITSALEYATLDKNQSLYLINQANVLANNIHHSFSELLNQTQLENMQAFVALKDNTARNIDTLVFVLTSVIMVIAALSALTFYLNRKNLLTTQHQKARLEEMVNDRTIELEKAVATADKANRAKTIFLSRMSHELRTPLNAIMGFSQLIAMDKSEASAEHNSYSECILDSSRHLLNLVNEVLDITAIESGKIEVKVSTFILQELIKEVVKLTSPLASSYSINVTYLDLSAINLKTDRQRLKEVLINLVSNAIKYNKPNGEVKITARRTSEKLVELSIQDTGIGIDEAAMPRLFEPFERVNGTNPAIEGTGIGLTISQKLVQLLKGNIVVESTKDVGTTFIVELPIELEGQPLKQQKVMAMPPPSLHE